MLFNFCVELFILDSRHIQSEINGALTYRSTRPLSHGDSEDISLSHVFLIFGILIHIVVILICCQLLRRIFLEFPELKRTQKTVQPSLNRKENTKRISNPDLKNYDYVPPRNKAEGILNVDEMGNGDHEDESVDFLDGFDDELMSPPVIDWSEIPEGDPDPSCIPEWAIIPNFEQKYGQIN